MRTVIADTVFHVFSANLVMEEVMNLGLWTRAAAAALLSGAATGPAMAVIGSQYSDGVTVFNTWLRGAGDLYSGTALLEGNGYGCSGTLISSTAVLTAAHCADSLTRAYFVTDRRSDSQLASFTGHSIRATAVVPGWSNDLAAGNDLAIAFLATPAPASARISAVYQNNLNLAYNGTVFLGGYGLTRNAAGNPARSVESAMSGSVDGASATVDLMPYLQVGQNLIRPVDGATTAAARLAKTDLDRWFPSRTSALPDDTGFNLLTQRSPYGFQRHLSSGGGFTFTFGGNVFLPHLVEGTTASGDSGSAVFFNPRALVEDYFWHTRYDEMMAANGVPTQAMLGLLDDNYSDDTNYLVGVTSYSWALPGLCNGLSGSAKTNCINANVAAYRGGGGYTLLQPYIGWIETTLAAYGAGTLALGGANAVDGGSSSFTDIAVDAALLPLENLNLGLTVAVPEPAAAWLLAMGVTCMLWRRRRRA